MDAGGNGERSGPEAGWYDDPERPGARRYWDGSAWTEHRDSQAAARAGLSAPSPGPAEPPEDGAIVLTADERKELLADVIAVQMSKGYRIESQADFSAVMVKGHRINHVLHLILSILTLGAWLIVWFFVWAFAGERRLAITIDEYGR